MKKIVLLVISFVLCLAVTACGGGGDKSNDGSNESNAETITVKDISFQQPEGYALEVNENGDAECYDEEYTYAIGVYKATDEDAPGYDMYDPPAQNAEELYDCFINRNPDIASKEKIEIDGTEAYIVHYNEFEGGENETDVIFLYNNCVYTVMVFAAGDITNEQQKAFDSIVETITLN